jgi:hypothetical protein
LDETTESLLRGDLAGFERGFREIMQDTFSYYDTQTKYEYVYQAYLLGLLAILGDDYVIKSNRESGGGRYDIMLLPKGREGNGVVIEIKRTEGRKEGEDEAAFRSRIEKLLEEAYRQIERNEYYKELEANGLSDDRIVKVAIVFAGKVPYVYKPSAK